MMQKEQILKQPIYEDWSNNGQRTRQSAVSLIFKIESEINDPELDSFLIADQQGRDFTSPQNLLGYLPFSQLLFLQRAISLKDPNSGQIAFPGGKCEESESDFEAAVRETWEEVGINLHDKKIKAYYFGRLPPNFSVRKTRWQNKLVNLYCCAHVFLIIDKENITGKPNIQESEVSCIKWVPFSWLLDPSRLTIRQETKLNPALEQSFKGPLKPIWNSISKKFVASYLAQVDINMEQQLWGLTFYILVAFMGQIALKSLGDQKKQIEKFISKSKFIQIQFQDGYLLGKPFSWILASQFFKLRIKPCLQSPVSFNHVNSVIVLILISILSAIIYQNMPKL